MQGTVMDQQMEHRDSQSTPRPARLLLRPLRSDPNRAHARVSAFGSIRVRLDREDSHEAVLLDVSPMGVRFQVPKEIAPETQLGVELPCSLERTVQVHWCQAFADAFICGGSFDRPLNYEEVWRIRTHCPAS